MNIRRKPCPGLLTGLVLALAGCPDELVIDEQGGEDTASEDGDGDGDPGDGDTGDGDGDTGDGDGDTGDGDGDTGDGDGDGATCGNGVVEGDELCDDGNDLPGDTCSNDCVPPGHLLWERFDPNAPDGLRLVDVAVDPDGRIATVGGGLDEVLSLYEPDGTVVWSEVFPSNPGDSIQSLHAVAFHGDGDIIAAGALVDGEAARWIAKYDIDGQQVWEHRDVLPGKQIYYDVAIDDDGTIVAVGRADPVDADLIIQKYDADGVLVWTEYRSGGGFAVDFAAGVDIDEQGRIAVTGTIGSPIRAFLRLFDADGQELWANDWLSQGNTSQWGDAIRFAPDGSLWVVGRASTIGFVLHADIDGNVIDEWDFQPNPPETAYLRSLAITSTGERYVGGEFYVQGQNNNSWVAQLDEQAQAIWMATYTDWPWAHERIFSVALTPAGRLLAVGDFGNHGYMAEFAL